ncbi:MAG: urea ABC transporter permease subunit UrtB, partial [Chromatocurvus sp.]
MLLAAALSVLAGPALAEAAQSAQPGQAAEASAVDADALVLALPEGSFADRGRVAKQLAASGDPRAPAVLAALLEGRLLAAGTDDSRRILRRSGSGDETRDALTGAPVAAEVAAGARRIPVHNPLRIALRSLVAVATIGAADPTQRASALRRLMQDGVSDEVLAYLDTRVEQETDPGVMELLLAVRALARLDHVDPQVRLDSIALLKDSLLPEVRNRLETVAGGDTEQAVREAARSALQSIATSERAYRVLQNLFFGLSAGSVLLLAALGLAITFGVMGVINMAHGELIMIGAYTTWFIQTLMPDATGSGLLLAIPAAFAVAGLVGIAMERCVIQFLY